MFSIRISNLIDRTKYKTGWSLFRGGLEITLVSTFEIRDQEFFPFTQYKQTGSKQIFKLQ